MMADNVQYSQICGIFGEEPEDRLDPEDLPSVSGLEFQPKENTMVIVDKSGVHHLEVQCYHCPNAMSPDIQMF